MAQLATELVRRFAVPLLLSSVSFLFIHGSASAQEPAPSETAIEATRAYTPQELAETAALLRERYYDRAWELGAQVGEAWNRTAPDAFEVRAWHALNLARSGQVEEALKVARDLLERDPDGFWSSFAMAGAVFRHSDRWAEAAEPGEKAVSLEPLNLDALSLYADILRYTQGEQEAIDYIDALPPELGGTALVQVRKAVALDALAVEAQDDEARKEAFDHFRQVMAMDQDFLEPVFFLGSRLRAPEDKEEADALVRRAADLSPSHEVHVYVWRGIMARRDLDEDAKVALLDQAVQDLFARGGKTGGALHMAGAMYGDANRPETRDSLWAMAITEFPESPGAEWALVSRYRELSRQMAERQRAGEEPDPAFTAEYRRQLESFLLRPTFHRETLRGDAYRNLLYLLRDEEDLDPQLLYNVVRGVELYEGINLHIIYGIAPVLLADQGVYLDYAEALARTGRVKNEEQLGEYRGRNLFRTEEEFESAAKRSRSTYLDALGWVFFAQGKMDDAEGELLKAIGLTDQNPTAYLHLGKLYEKRHALALEEDPEDGATDFLDQALDFYLKGTLVQSMGENPNQEPLEALYARRHGSMEGFEDFVAGANATDADARRDKILAERIAEPEAMASFTMATLEGDTIRSEELAGKVVVINFWGTWCGPCVVEMPGIQKFYEAYRDDPGVVVLTLSNDENLDALRRFMVEGDYTFSVMLDDGYVDAVKVRAFPTTWFVTPQGRRAFEKRGWSDDLPQEFGWRVESLREGGTPPFPG